MDQERLADIKAKAHNLGLGRFIYTAFVERLNLTLRQGASVLIRRTWARAQSAAELALRLEWWRGYYHFVHYRQALHVALAHPIDRGGHQQPQHYRSRTPAMAAWGNPPSLDSQRTPALSATHSDGLTYPQAPKQGPVGNSNGQERVLAPICAVCSGPEPRFQAPCKSVTIYQPFPTAVPQELVGALSLPPTAAWASVAVKTCRFWAARVRSRCPLASPRLLMGLRSE